MAEPDPSARPLTGVGRPDDAISGPLRGLRIVEIGSIGPGPMCGMLFADHGADVVRIDRVSDIGARVGPHAIPWRLDVSLRGRRSLALDLKEPSGVQVLLRLVSNADVLFEGFRPDVAERLGIGPDTCLAINQRLVYGRITGWGRDGPLSQRAGHDINYAAVAGALAHLGRRESPPFPPLNLVSDLGGGAMFLAFGVLAALVERSISGLGQIVDAAMVDGTAALMALFSAGAAAGTWSPNDRGSSAVDGGSHYYEVYQCADGRYICLGSVEPKFYRELITRLGLGEDAGFAVQNDPSAWPELKRRLTELFLSKPSGHWSSLLEQTDSCFAPVVPLPEAAEHPHNVARGVFVEAFGVAQARPAPRFSRTDGAIRRPPAYPGEHSGEVLSEWLGLSATELDALVASGAVGCAAGSGTGPGSSQRHRPL